MIPVWAKVDGKWVTFPTHLLQTLEDGSTGFRFHTGRNEHEKVAVFKQFREHFCHNPVNWYEDQKTPTYYEYRLRKQP